jgi:hypothetical protein
MKKTNLSENYDLLYSLLPIIMEIRYGLCSECTGVNLEVLAERMINLFEKLKIEYKEVNKENSVQAYNDLRLMILNDETLSTGLKLELVKMM